MKINNMSVELIFWIKWISELKIGKDIQNNDYVKYLWLNSN